ncbi:MAG TPA: helix-turn-helix domain-containing protein [Ferrovibrio sp.]
MAGRGASIQQVAANLAYESVPSFVTMFRKVFGTSPGRYMAERLSGRT